MPMAFNDVGECYVVLLRFRTKRVRYVVVILPGKSGGDWSVLERRVPGEKGELVRLLFGRSASNRSRGCKARA